MYWVMGTACCAVLELFAASAGPAKIESFSYRTLSVVQTPSGELTAVTQGYFVAPTRLGLRPRAASRISHRINASAPSSGSTETMSVFCGRSETGASKRRRLRTVRFVFE